jgi:hypothetical protein
VLLFIELLRSARLELQAESYLMQKRNLKGQVQFKHMKSCISLGSSLCQGLKLIDPLCWISNNRRHLCRVRV